MSMRYKTMNMRIKDLANIVDIQANEPSVEYDKYMQGMYNGLELALAIVEDRQPVYKKLNKLSWLDWLKVKVDNLFYFGW